MAELLLLYSTVDGQTLRICERMKNLIEASGQRVVPDDVQDGGEQVLEVLLLGQIDQPVDELLEHRSQIVVDRGQEQRFFVVEVHEGGGAPEPSVP